MKQSFFAIVVCVLLPLVSFSQVTTRIIQEDSTAIGKDSISQIKRPDQDRNNIPFIDYRKGVIWNTPTDSMSDYVYIRKNFTDQMVSVWSNPKRLYPASRIYAVDVENKHYRAIKVSDQNYVFAEQMVKGKMNLYMYRKIPQFNGWVEMYSYDSRDPNYRNNMIIEKDWMRGKQDYFGYFISLDDITLKEVPTTRMKDFANDYLSATPDAYKKAMKFGRKNYNKERKLGVAALLAFGTAGLWATNGNNLLFLLAFPAGAVVGLLNKPHSLHWQDMVEIVNTYNKEKGKGK